MLNAILWAQIGIAATLGCLMANAISWIVNRLKSGRKNESGVIRNSGIIKPNCGLR